MGGAGFAAARRALISSRDIDMSIIAGRRVKALDGHAPVGLLRDLRDGHFSGRVHGTERPSPGVFPSPALLVTSRGTPAEVR